MKLILIILFTFSTAIVCGQTTNEKLFKAVLDRDSVNVGILLSEGGNPNFKVKQGNFEMSMLINAVQKQDVKIVKLLLEHKAEVDFKDWFKTTALMYAANTGSKPIVELLIAYGANPKAKDGQGNSVLSAAKESKNQDVIKLIESLQKK